MFNDWVNVYFCSMFFLKTTVLIFFYCLISLVKAQNDRVLFSLEEAVLYALENNLSLKNSALDVTRSKFQMAEVTSEGLPRVNGGFGYNYFLDRPVQLIPGEFFGMPVGDMMEVRFGTEHIANLDLSASQLLIDLKYIMGVRASREFMNLSRAEFTYDKINIKANTAKSYYSVIIAEHNLELIKQSKDNIEAIKSENEALLKEGFLDKLDFRQMELMFNDIDDQVKKAERSLREQKDLLKLVMGYELEKEIELEVKFNEAIEFMLNTSARLDSFDFKAHVEYDLVHSNMRLMKLNTWVEKTTLLPNVQVFYSLQQQAQRGDFNIFSSNHPWYRTQIVGMKVNVPIFGSGHKISRIGQAQMDYEKARNMELLVTQQLKLRSKKNREDFKTSLELFLSSKENLSLAKDIFNKTKLKFKEGMASSFELNESRKQELLMQTRYLNASMALCNAKLELMKSNGEL